MYLQNHINVTGPFAIQTATVYERNLGYFRSIEEQLIVIPRVCGHWIELNRHS